MRNKWIYTMFVLVLSLFAACSDRSDDQPADKGKTRTVVFRLSVDDAVGSRAAWDTNENPLHGTGIENRIDLNGLRVAIYSINSDGTVYEKVGEADNLLYWPIENSDADDPIEYQLVGDISDVELEVDEDYRFMVYANFPHTSNNQFDLEDIDVEKGYIPMWGVATKKIEGGDLEELGTIDLLRAAAKVEVTFTNDVTDNYNISKLAVKNYSNTGNNLPTGWNVAASTGALDMDECIHVTGSHVHGSDLSFLANEEDGKYYIYIPEYRNASHVKGEQSVVVITLTDKNGAKAEKTYEIPFSQYTPEGILVDNTVHDIVRNHIYRFNVTGVKSGNLLLNFNVADWSDGASINLGSLAYPTYVNPVLPDPSYHYTGTRMEDEYAPKMKYSANDADLKSFVMYFNFVDAHLAHNEAFVWRPGIVDQSTNHYEIKVYKETSTGYDDLVYHFIGDAQVEEDKEQVNLLKPDSGNNNSEDVPWKGWFKIVVTPTGHVAVDTNFTFGIACGVHPSGFPDNDFYLFINGENNQIAWPESSGNDRKFIVIKQEMSN